MTIVGALLRVDETVRDTIRRDLASLPGVTPFDLERTTQMGLVIEASNLDDAYHLLTYDVREVGGVLHVSPVYAHFGR